MNRFYSTIGRVRRVDSLSKLLILRLKSILATHIKQSALGAMAAGASPKKEVQKVLDKRRGLS